MSSAGPLFTKPRKGILIGWAALAVLNLLAGVVLSLSPERLTDLESMARWARQWLAGVNVYNVANSYVDYPPNAILLLSPLGLVPLRIAAPVWVLINIVFACLAPLVAARFVRPHAPVGVIALPILMFLCWGGIRTLTQFTLVALMASMAALVQAERRPVTAGMLLSVALLKPPVALPVLLWTVFARRWRVMWVSLATTTAAIAVFCVRVQETPVSVAEGYLGALMVYHGAGDHVLTGFSELRPIIWTLVSDRSYADVVTAAVAVALLAAICWIGRREGMSGHRVIYAAPILTACWVLLTFRHLTYGFLVLLPVFMLVARHDRERSRESGGAEALRGAAQRSRPQRCSPRADRLRIAMFWALQLAMMFDIPGLTRRLGLEHTALYTHVLVHSNRALFVALFAGIAAIATRERSPLPPITGRLSLPGTAGPPLAR